MVIQINLKIQDEFYELAKQYASSRGYMNIQELVRDALREKIFDEMEVREDYLDILKSKETNTFLSVSESKRLHDELKERANLYGDKKRVSR